MADNDLPSSNDGLRAGSDAADNAVFPSSTGAPTLSPEAPKENVSASTPQGVKRPGDRVFEFFSTASSVLITIIIAAIGLFLLIQAVPPLLRNEGGLIGFFTYTGQWQTANLDQMQFGIPNLFFFTVMISLIALILAMPVALGIALFLSNYAPKQLVRPLGTLVDMLAAVPSIVYGLWGAQVLGPALGGFYEWVNSWAATSSSSRTTRTPPPSPRAATS